MLSHLVKFLIRVHFQLILECKCYTTLRSKNKSKLNQSYRKWLNSTIMSKWIWESWNINQLMHIDILCRRRRKEMLNLMIFQNVHFLTRWLKRSHLIKQRLVKLHLLKQKMVEVNESWPIKFSKRCLDHLGRFLESSW